MLRHKDPWPEINSWILHILPTLVNLQGDDQLHTADQNGSVGSTEYSSFLLLDSCRWVRYVVLEDGNYRLSGKSVRSYHSTMRNVPEERCRCHLYCGGSLKSHRFGGIQEKMGLNLGQVIAKNFEVRHSRCVGSITKNFCVLHIQLNTTIFHLVVHNQQQLYTYCTTR